MSESRPTITGPLKIESPYPVLLKGLVSKGFGRGSKELGIATANLPENIAAEASKHLETGIYYGWARVLSLDDQVYPMVMSYGWNPYYKNEKRSAEVHIMHEFKEDFYDIELRVAVCGFIRNEKNYKGVDALIEDIMFDIKVAHNSLDRESYVDVKRLSFLVD